MSENSLWKVQQHAAKNKNLSADSFRLLYLIASRFPLTCHREPFKLSVPEAATMLGFSPHSKKTAERAIDGLYVHGYLLKRGTTGCPPTNNYLVSNSVQMNPIKSTQLTANKSVPVTANKSVPVTANHISNPFGKNIDTNGSNSSGASAPTGNVKGKQQRPVAEGISPERAAAFADELRKFKKNLKPS